MEPHSPPGWLTLFESLLHPHFLCMLLGIKDKGEAKCAKNCSWRWLENCSQSGTAHLPRRPTARVNEMRVDHNTPLERLCSAMEQLCLGKEVWSFNCSKKTFPTKKTHKEKDESLQSDTSDFKPCLNKPGSLSGQHAIQRLYQVLIYFQETLTALFKVLKKKEGLGVICSSTAGNW